MSEHMRNRLERLKQNPVNVRRPLTVDDLDPQPSKRLITPETVYMRKVERVMMKHTETKRKMLSGSDQYLSLYHELKKAENDFLDLLADPEIKYLDLPDVFLQKIEEMKKKLQTIK